MARTHRRLSVGVAALAAVGLASLGLVATGAGGPAANDPGVSPKSVKLGYIFSETGVASSSSQYSGKAFQARIDRQNADGGVNGRKIETEIVDDKSSANLTAAKDLVENRHVFAVVNDSPLGFL